MNNGYSTIYIYSYINYILLNCVVIIEIIQIQIISILFNATFNKCYV